MSRQHAAKPHKVATQILRAGYTLIELLIAAVLTASLMTVIWGLLSMYNGWLTAGRAQSEERQLRRSLRVQLQEDLEAVALMDIVRETQFLESAAEASFAEQDSISLDTAEDPLVSAMEPRLEAEDLPTWLQSLQLPGDVPGVPSVSMIGTSTLLRLVVPARVETVDSHSVQPAAEGAAVEAGAPDAPVAEYSDEAPLAGSQLPPQNQPAPVRIIIWQFRPWGGSPTGISSVENADMTVEGPSASQVQLPEFGLTRQEWDGMTLLQLVRQQGVNNAAGPLSMESGDTSAATPMEPVAPLDQEHIPESMAVQFAYFDGRAWQSSWNSAAQGGLPVALRLRMWMVSSAAAEKLMIPAGSVGLPESVAGTSVPAADIVSSSERSDTVVPLQLVETLVVLQPISGAMPGLAGPEAEAGLSGGGL
jgi:type II secretory pathway pseudopilin PulG